MDIPRLKPFEEWKERDSRDADLRRAADAAEIERIVAEDPFYAEDWEMSTEDLTPSWLPL